MQNLDEFIAALETSDARSSLYYLSRYLKQAAQFDEYGKDIFEDDQGSLPSEKVRNRTLEMVAFIESKEGIPVAEFDDAAYMRWSSYVADLESSLQGEASPIEIERATEFISSILIPTPTK